MLFQLVFSAVWMELQLDVVNVRRLVQPLVTTVLTALTAVVLADLMEFQLAVRLDWMPDQLDIVRVRSCVQPLVTAVFTLFRLDVTEVVMPVHAVARLVLTAFHAVVVSDAIPDHAADMDALMLSI